MFRIKLGISHKRKSIILFAVFILGYTIVICDVESYAAGTYKDFTPVSYGVLAYTDNDDITHPGSAHDMFINAIDLVTIDNNLDIVKTSADSLVTQVSQMKSEVNSYTQSVTNGKALLSSTLTNHGVSTASNATFETLNSNINSLATLKYNQGVSSVAPSPNQIVAGEVVNGITGTGVPDGYSKSTFTRVPGSVEFNTGNAIFKLSDFGLTIDDILEFVGYTPEFITFSFKFTCLDDHSDNYSTIWLSVTLRKQQQGKYLYYYYDCIMPELIHYGYSGFVGSTYNERVQIGIDGQDVILLGEYGCGAQHYLMDNLVYYTAN